MPRYVPLRLLDTFFRHWFLYLFPFVLVTGFGVMSVRDQSSTYRSTGTFYVEGETFLSTLTAVRGGDLGYQTPAEHYGGQLRALLQTDAFVEEIADQAGMSASVYGSAHELRGALRQAISVSSSGENLLVVSVELADAAAAHRLADTVITGFVQWQIDSDVDASTAAQGFLDPLIETYEQDLATARQALDGYLRDHPELPGEETRPLAQQVVIDRLQSDVSLAEQRFTNARAKKEEARLATAQTESDVRQRLQLLDAPTLPSDPEPTLMRAVMVVGLFGVMGAMLAAAAVVAGSSVDRAIRHPLEVKQRLGLDLLAVLPEVRR